MILIPALIVGPIILGLGTLVIPRRAAAAAKAYACLVALAVLSATIASASAPDASVRWLSRPFAAAFHVGWTGIGYWLAVLLALVTFCSLVAAQSTRLRDFVGAILVLEGTMMGVFAAKDLLLFALFWDFMLIPVFLIMIGWGPTVVNAWRYLIYNLAAGLTLLLGTAAFGIANGSTDVIGRTGVVPLAQPWAAWIFAGFAFAFLVKTPVWPVHTWMPDTYADLPPAVAALVSAVQSKAGLYGFIVIGIPLFPSVMQAARPLMFVLGLIALLYGACTALVERDVKRVVAYSSLSHLGLILIAIFSGGDLALRGAYVYLIGHGLFSAALFLVLGYVEHREETRVLDRLGGLGIRNPRLAGALVLPALAALGLPGLAGFAGEILILTGVYRAGFVWPAAIALIPVVIAAAYMLRVYQGMMHGPPVADLPERPDMNWIEGLALAPLVVAFVLLGVQPAPIANVGSTPLAAQQAAAFTESSR
jgi:NADH-quinone oxidoreductase subunit M